MISFLTVKEAEICYEIKRSEFFAYAYRVTEEEQIFDIVRSLKKKHAGCSHVCYAAVFDDIGNRVRFSDDGEPGGTAGQPILEVIKNKNLKETLVAVVRYFGGIKLGAGGLVRAYTASAVEVLNLAKKISVKECDTCKLQLDFSLYKRLSKTIMSKFIVLDTEYSDAVTISLASDTDNLYDQLYSITEGKGIITKTENRFIEAEIDG